MSHDTTIFVGLDVHKDSITVACVGTHPDEPVVDVGTIGTRQYAIDRMLKKLSGRGQLRLVYEAGPCGFCLHRYLTDQGLDCVVAAPSLIPKRPGDRIKTDRRDARNLALALRAGNLTAVHIPTPDQEEFRDVVRAWQQAKRDVTAARQRLKSFLLRHDVRYTGRANWSAAHRRWLAEAGDLSCFPHPRQFMAWLGLVPGEHSSGATRRQGPITRCGNRWARTLLVEAAWSYRYRPKVSRIIEARAGDIDPAIREIAWRAQLRLHHVYRKLRGRGKHINVVITAVARELAAFIWDAARQLEAR